ncbi:hypothetical protein GWI33_001928 [Rhynchophorus ferrugineus]|uniref:Uncharacterized protein n=1 Tax=Rhynchophorus ferrugineus TaxID=354439 RepID=A0A834MJT7_RHYFE|nr:hypothetical protein GWI33_001928 [Rhynchophorus ferrugineus]
MTRTAREEKNAQGAPDSKRIKKQYIVAGFVRMIRRIEQSANAAPPKVGSLKRSESIDRWNNKKNLTGIIKMKIAYDKDRLI